MQTIAILSRKGGVGKTATAHALGAGLKRRGYKVLFVDLDSQGNLTFSTGAAAGRANAYDLLTGAADAEDAITRTQQGDIITASPNLAGADIMITERRKEYRLKEALQEVAGNYDFCVIDTPTTLGILTANALTAANGVIIPAQAEIFSLQGLVLLRETVAAVKKSSNPALSVYGILLTRFNTRTVISRDMRENLEQVAAALKTKVYAEPIRECAAVPEAQARQQSVFEYAPRRNPAKDYNAFIDELLQDMGGRGNAEERL